MNKKEYIAPSMEIVEFVSDIVMQISSNLHDDEEADSKDQLSNNRRGSWGNLWE